jgi:hypothetical protein
MPGVEVFMRLTPPASVALCSCGGEAKETGGKGDTGV